MLRGAVASMREARRAVRLASPVTAVWHTLSRCRSSMDELMSPSEDATVLAPRRAPDTDLPPRPPQHRRPAPGAQAVSRVEATTLQMLQADTPAAELNEFLEDKDVSVMSLQTNNRVLHALKHAGHLKAVEAYFARMLEHSAVSYQAVVECLLRADNLDGVASYAERLVATDRSMLDAGIVAIILDHLCKQPPGPATQRLLDLMRNAQLKVNKRRLSSQLNYLPTLEAKERYVDLMQAIGAEPDQFELTTLVAAAGKARQLDRAEHYFDMISKFGYRPDLAAYNALLDGLSHDPQRALAVGQRCLEMLQSMRAAALQPDTLTLVAMLRTAGYLQRRREPARSQRPQGGPAPVDPQALIRTLVDEALKLQPDIDLRQVYAGAMDASVRVTDYDGLRAYFAEMQRHGVFPTVGTALMVTGAVINNARCRPWRPLARRLERVFHVIPAETPKSRSFRPQTVPRSRLLNPQELALFLDFVNAVGQPSTSSASVPVGPATKSTSVPVST
eukprot:TRINITY_DN5913_c0_g6_i1.p1 TRINITY_DN5913_c0_g6~~TRINITY_DN5913_c0_g6_i1.p1  ORF type:complete len:504 (+),score=135.78 TRINITY_DN5913_c0_g6_i1:116-1627(+)